MNTHHIDPRHTTPSGGNVQLILYAALSALLPYAAAGMLLLLHHGG